MDILISIGKNADPANYVHAVELAGGTPCAAYLPKTVRSFDGLILAGGGDIEPSLYGQRNCGSCQIDYTRDQAELALLEAFAQARKPVLGICRGHQVVNIWAGGGLIQDLGEQNMIHRWEDRDKIHLAFAVGGVLKELYGGCIRVNSAHHQGVGPIGKGMIVTARSADGIVEAMEHESLPVFAVQFHPERMNGPETADGSKIFRWFLEKCNERKMNAAYL